MRCLVDEQCVTVIVGTNSCSSLTWPVAGGSSAVNILKQAKVALVA
jgi:hypothetical protein